MTVNSHCSHGLLAALFAKDGHEGGGFPSDAAVSTFIECVVGLSSGVTYAFASEGQHTAILGDELQVLACR